MREIGTDCFRLADVVDDETPLDDDELSEWEEGGVCFSFSLDRSRTLSKDDGDEEFERSVLKVKFPFVSQADGDEH